MDLPEGAGVPAKLTDRFLAYLIDTVPFMFGFRATLARTTLPSILALGVWLLIYLGYQWLSNARGASIGKRCLGLRVVGADGRPLGPRRALVRSFGLLLSTPLLNLGFLWAFVNAESRTWHDLLAGSRVIEIDRKSPGESAATAAASLILVALIVGWTAWSRLARPTPADLDAVQRARDGLGILGQVEESYKARHGSYTADLSELASESGDVAQFQEGMFRLFDSRRILIQATRDKYYFRAYARDRKSTLVSMKGP